MCLIKKKKLQNDWKQLLMFMRREKENIDSLDDGFWKKIHKNEEKKENISQSLMKLNLFFQSFSNFFIKRTLRNVWRTTKNS